jgi:tetratricopeptide (TPR) repeat protein
MSPRSAIGTATRLAALWLALVIAPAPTHGQPGAADVAAAERLLDDGLGHYDRGEYALAIEALVESHRLDPRPEVLFAVAQAARLGGDCALAADYYERFLATDPAPHQAEAATMHLSACRAALAEADTAPEPAGEPAAVLAPAERAGEAGPWYTDVVGDALLGGGAVTLAASAGFFRAKRAAERDAAAADTYAEHAGHLDRARTNRNRGLATVTIGSALVGGAVWRFVRHERARKADHLVIEPTGGGVAVGVRGRF